MTISRPFKREADFDHLSAVIRRETTDGPAPIMELLVDGSILCMPSSQTAVFPITAYSW